LSYYQFTSYFKGEYFIKQKSVGLIAEWTKS